MRLQKKQTGFAQVANAVLNDRAISAKAKGIYAYLWSKPDDWDFSVERIAADFTDGEKALYSGMKELEVAGYVERLKQGDGKMVYMLHLETAHARRIGLDPTAQKGELEGGPNSPFGLVAETGGIYKTEESQQTKNILQGAAEKTENADDGFAAFWSAYPKKADKKLARAAWLKMDDASRAAATAAVPRWLELWNLPGESAFVIDPVRFLNRERYGADALETVLKPKLEAARERLAREAKAAASAPVSPKAEMARALKASEEARARREAEEAERIRKDAEARDFSERVLRFFEALPDGEREKIGAAAEASLAERGIVPGGKFPKIYEVARRSKIVQLTRPEYERFVNETPAF